MRKMTRLISFGFNCPFQPRNSIIKPLQLDEIGANIVVGISEFGININGGTTLLDGLAQLALKMVSPAQECVCLRRGMQFERGFVKLDSAIVITLHLSLISIL